MKLQKFQNVFNLPALDALLKVSGPSIPCSPTLDELTAPLEYPPRLVRGSYPRGGAGRLYG